MPTSRSQTPVRRKRKWRIPIGILLALILPALAISWFQRHYPYGMSHSCETQLMFALQNYANANQGWFPRGEATPEASLSLLYQAGLASPEMLHGKSVRLREVRERLAAGLLLTPETCGWHYVEGLRLDDPPKLALFWDKVGLGHDGERSNVYRVYFVDLTSEPIPKTEWDQFLQSQTVLRKTIKR
jgi:hypothetical protein